MVRACAEVESAIPRDAWPVVLVDHSMKFQAPIGTIAKLCRHIIGISGILKSTDVRHDQEAKMVLLQDGHVPGC